MDTSPHSSYGYHDQIIFMRNDVLPIIVRQRDSWHYLFLPSYRARHHAPCISLSTSGHNPPRTKLPTIVFISPIGRFLLSICLCPAALPSNGRVCNVKAISLIGSFDKSIVVGVSCVPRFRVADGTLLLPSLLSHHILYFYVCGCP